MTQPIHLEGKKSPDSREREERVLVHVSSPEEGERLLELLRRHELAGLLAPELKDLCRCIGEGAGAVVLSGAAVNETNLSFLQDCLGEVPPWSDLPLLLITRGGMHLQRALEALSSVGGASNITFIQEPVQEVDLLNALRVALRARRRQYEVRDLIAQRETLLSSIRDSFVILDQDWRFLYVNERGAEMHARRAEELIGFKKWEVFPELIGSAYHRALEQAVKEGRMQRVEYYDPAIKRWIENRIYPSEVGVSVFGTDITERKQAEEALRESEERLRLMVESAREYAIFSLDPDGKITSWNSGAERLIGYSEEEVLGRSFEIIFTESDREAGQPASELKQALEADRAEDERWHVRRDGSRFWAGGLTTRMLDEEGRVHGFVKILRDYTGRKHAEVWLRSLNETLEKRVAERTEEAEQRATQLRLLASEVTDAEQRERRRLAELLHDHLQQILVAAKMQIGALSQRPLDAPLTEGLKRVDGLLKRSIEASRSLTVELSPPILYDAGLAPALQWLSRSMMENHNLKLKIDADAGAEPESDNIRAFLFQAVRELLFNVVKHAQIGQAEIHLRRVESQVEVMVVDRGAGFETVKKRNRSEQGGGFGLFSIRERVELLGGSLQIETAPGAGTRVRVRVPARQPNEDEVNQARDDQVQAVVKRPETPARDGAPGEGSVIRVLLADDHKILREGLAGLLREQHDFEVVSEASDGQMAVEMAHETRPDVIIMDVSMPRLNGVEATRRISSDLPDIAIIGLSMHSQEDMANSMQQAGAVAYVTKGAPSEILMATIREAYMERWRK
jgi:PAS domain S-box-containing protein